MTEDSPTPQTTTIPIVQDIELRLAKMRRQLEGIFVGVQLAEHEVSVCAEAARSHGMPDVAQTLDLSICNRLFSQMRSLTHVIEKLGGTTDLSEKEEPTPSPPESGENRNG